MRDISNGALTSNSLDKSLGFKISIADSQLAACTMEVIICLARFRELGGQVISAM